MENKNLGDLFKEVKDFRVKNRCIHKLSDILFIAICTLICNGEDFEDMAEFGKQRYDWLKSVLELPGEIPSHDTFNRVLQYIEPESLSAIMVKDGQLLLDTLVEKQICFDGKKVKGHSPKEKGNKGLYILSAWVSENKLCVGQQKVNNKSNEIKAIPELIETLDIRESIVTIDAIGCQKAIAEQIIDKEADYLLALKKNQKESFEKVEEAFRFHATEKFHQTIDKDHGREEVRKCSILPVSLLPEEETPSDWKGLNTLVMVEAKRIVKDKEQEETRYYLSSDKEVNPAYYNMLVRGHWSIENELHWHLDVTFNEDKSRARTGNSQLNLNILRKFALQKISQIKDNLSKKKRRYRASLNNEYLKKILKI